MGRTNGYSPECNENEVDDQFHDERERRGRRRSVRFNDHVQYQSPDREERTNYETRHRSLVNEESQTHVFNGPGEDGYGVDVGEGDESYGDDEDHWDVGEEHEEEGDDR